MERFNDPTPPIDPIDALIAVYIQAIEAGQVPNRQDWLDRHPSHAEALQTFFADFDRMDRVASPLRMDADPYETRVGDENGPIVSPIVCYFGDYELLEEVARGGMGIVYKARQASLNRLVALKMVLTGAFASPREVARFQAEAEAAANLDHPNIVPVYEVGEHQGQHYFSMKFIEGTSLAAHPRGPARDEVQGLITVAQAVHHAHQRGVLHRDLKPSNILIDPKGDHHVTDFGLAKRLGDIDRSLTEPGQVLGTPRYMAPEQAAGRRDLTVAADVFSIGVILYERLTGRPPFTGDNVLTLLRQVRETDPPRPSTIHPGLDHDLETIVLKCLDKEPSRRYPSAEDLAEDLSRWFEGRPIAARPVGQTERFSRWCRRNPTVAGLIASVALALILGAIVSTLFALRERRAAINAKKAEGVAIAARDDTERTFARSLVRPLNPDGNGSDRDTVLSEPELQALWELAGQGNNSLRLRFLDEAIRDPLALRQLRARSEPALIAAIGLDLDRRARASKRLFESLNDPRLSITTRAEVSFLFLEIEERSGPAGKDPSAVILQSLAGESSPDLRAAWENHLIKSSEFRDARETVNLLVAALERKTGASARRSLATALSGVSSRLGAAEAARACGRAAQVLVAAIEGGADASARSDLASALSGVSSRLGAAEASGVARALAAAIERETDASIRYQLASTLSGVSARLGAAEASGVARALAAAIERETDVSIRRSLVSALKGLSSRLGAAEASGVARALAAAIERETDASVRYQLASALFGVSARLESGEASGVARALAAAIERETGAYALGSLATALSGVSSRLGAAEAARACGRAAQVLVAAIEGGADASARSDLASALSGVSSRLGAAEAARACGRAAQVLVAAIEHENNTSALGSLASALSDLSSRLGAGEAAGLARALVAKIERETGAGALDSLASALSGVSARLESGEAAGLARALVAKIERETGAGALDSLASALSGVSARLESGEAAGLARALVAKIERETGAYRLASLATALSGVSSRLGAAEAARACGRAAQVLVAAIEGGADAYRLGSLATALSGVSSRLGAAEAARACGRAAPILAAVFEREINAGTNSFALGPLAIALTNLTERMEPDQVVGVARSVILSLLQSQANEKYFLYKRSKDGLHTVRFGDFMLDQLDSGPARVVAREVAAQLFEGKSQLDNWTLRAILTDRSRKRQVERAYQIAVMTFDQGIIAASMRLVSEPFPCRLITADLVELLKFPTCLGENRRIVLDALGNIHDRRFANHWEFVRFAQEKGLKLDFTSPPRRPDPKASLERLRKELPE